MATWIDLNAAISEGRGVERPFNCPLHVDRHASATVNVERGVWYCHRCQKGGKTPSGTHDMAFLRLLDADAEVPVLPWRALEYTRAYQPFSSYWAGRFGEQVAKRYGTGTDPVTGWPVVPLVSNCGGRLHGFQLRNGSDSGPKYIYPRAVPVSKLLFGAADAAVGGQVDTVVLVEGASDVMSLARWPQRGVTVLGVYGSGVKLPQTRYVVDLRPRRILAAMDADAAGADGNARTVASFEAAGVQAETVDWSVLGVGDPGELTSSPWDTIL